MAHAAAANRAPSSCCADPIAGNLYDALQAGEVPEAALLASAGCGNPTALAEENKRKAGAKNVEFLKGEIERVPLPDNSVDVIISNCAIKLSADRDRVLREALRVLKPGGRFAVSDVVRRGEIPAEVRRSVLLWVGCVAGALDKAEYRAEDASAFLAEKGLDAGAIAAQVDGKIFSAFIRATKPS